MSEGMQFQPDASSAGGSAGRCIVLCDDGALPEDLAQALRRQGAEVVGRSCPSQVMVDLALAGADVLVMVDPDRLPMSGELLEAVHTYYPQVDCLRFTPAAEGRAPGLSRINGRDGLRQADETARRLESLVVRVPDAEGLLDGPLISEEELAMLLGSSPGGPGRSGAERNG